MVDQRGDGVSPERRASDRQQAPGSTAEAESEPRVLDLSPLEAGHLPAPNLSDSDHLPAQVPHDADHLPAPIPQPHVAAPARSAIRIDIWSVGQLVTALLLLPTSVFSASLLAMPFGAARWTAVIVFYASGVCLLLQPVAKAFAFTVLKCRTPTQYELRRLERVWPSVLARTNLRENRFSVMISTGSGVNAIATFGRLIAVTRGAMALPDAELEGILAHEVGHHLRLHTFVTAAVFWLTLPVIAVSSVVTFVRRVLRMLGWVIWLSGFGLLLALVLWFLGLVVGLLFVSIAVQSVLLILFGRFAEYSADDAAVQLGFGPGLLSAFQMMAAVEPIAEPPTLVDRFWASHPPLYKRIRRLENTVAV